MKHNNRPYVRAFVFSVLLASFFACETPRCEYEGVYMNCGFYYFDGSELTDTLFNSLDVFASANTDSSLLNETGSAVGAVQLPLSMIDDSSMFIFRFDSLSSDTLVFYHTKNLHLVSHECGFVHFFEISGAEYTHNNVDSLWIRKSLIEYGEEENIKIYF
ncbi:MAG: hypothetical protein K9H26_16350 [Prolixibacteraceae bacterium]|nr:hypothetical protein [Prolixibacteraceae bacterium]